jgi:hypothetical protein
MAEREDPQSYGPQNFANGLPATEEKSLYTNNWQPADLSALRLLGRDLQPAEQMSRLLCFGRAVGDEMRLLILALLIEEDRPIYGQEIAERLRVTPQTISHHLLDSQIGQLDT